MEKGEERLRYNNVEDCSMRAKEKRYITSYKCIMIAYSRGHYCHGCHGSPGNRQ